jgi:hypothetical protein
MKDIFKKIDWKYVWLTLLVMEVTAAGYGIWYRSFHDFLILSAVYVGLVTCCIIFMVIDKAFEAIANFFNRIPFKKIFTQFFESFDWKGFCVFGLFFWVVLGGVACLVGDVMFLVGALSCFLLLLLYLFIDLILHIIRRMR